jgi:hypothetical protein
MSSEAASVRRELARLEDAEREISAKRRRLQECIDAIYLSATMPPEAFSLLDQFDVLLDRFDVEERAISDSRRQIHRRIDTLRASIGLPPVRRTDTAAGRAA